MRAGAGRRFGRAIIDASEAASRQFLEFFEANMMDQNMRLANARCHCRSGPLGPVGPLRMPGSLTRVSRSARGCFAARLWVDFLKPGKSRHNLARIRVGIENDRKAGTINRYSVWPIRAVASCRARAVVLPLQ